MLLDCKRNVKLPAVLPLAWVSSSAQYPFFPKAIPQALLVFTHPFVPVDVEADGRSSTRFQSIESPAEKSIVDRPAELLD